MHFHPMQGGISNINDDKAYDGCGIAYGGISVNETRFFKGDLFYHARFPDFRWEKLQFRNQIDSKEQGAVRHFPNG